MEQVEVGGEEGHALQLQLLVHPHVSHKLFYPRKDEQPLPSERVLSVQTTYRSPSAEEGEEEDTALPTLSCYYHRSSNKQCATQTHTHSCSSVARQLTLGVQSQQEDGRALSWQRRAGVLLRTEPGCSLHPLAPRLPLRDGRGPGASQRQCSHILSHHHALH
jgi:hypothetical protein